MLYSPRIMDTQVDTCSCGVVPASVTGPCELDLALAPTIIVWEMGTKMMKTVLDIVDRTPEPAPWSEGDNIPWDDPGFSERMLEPSI